MARQYTHYCLTCRWDTITAFPIWECPWCGGELEVASHGRDPISAPARESKEAIDDVIEGFEELLRRS